MKTKVFLWALSAALCVGVPAAADTIVFSEQISSLGEDGFPYTEDNFNATIDYSFSGSTLTLVVANASNPAHTLSLIYLNYSGNASNPSLVSVSPAFDNAKLAPDQQAGPYGTYDLEFDFYESGNNGLASGDTATIQIDFAGTGLTAADFFDTATSSSKGDFIAAVKFTQGPDDSSTYAVGGTAVVPEPATVTLLGLGLAGAALRMRKRSKKS